MNWLNRYLRGEHEAVWSEMLAMGAAVRQEPAYSEAQAVCKETMCRVRRNCEKLVTRLTNLGFDFRKYPDGSRRDPSPVPLSDSSEDYSAEIEALGEEAGTLPLSIAAFWEQVGAVDLVGMHPDWPEGLDPLVVDPPEGALAMLYEDDEGMFAGLAPDDLHKDNVSGGDPYGMYLPNAAADFKFENERSNQHFVAYLRSAILQYGGFPGLKDQERDFEPLQGLIADLEVF